jgi:hypothetical protein
MCQIYLVATIGLPKNALLLQIFRLSKWYESNVILKLKSGFRIILQWDEVYNKRLLHCENRIILQIGIYPVKDLRCDWLVTIGRYLKVSSS